MTAGTCQNGCQCANTSVEMWRRDEIVVRGVDKLPIKQISVGDVATDRKHAHVSIGPVVCVDRI